MLHRYRIVDRFSSVVVDGLLGGPGYTIASFHISRLDDAIASIRYSVAWYGAGAAHPNSYTRTFNFALDPVTPLSPESIFTKPDIALAMLSDYCIAALLCGDRNESVVRSGAGRTWENYSSVGFDDNGIVVQFDPYQVDCYAAGPQMVIVPYQHIRGILNPAIEWYSSAR